VPYGIDHKKYSELIPLLRITACCAKFVRAFAAHFNSQYFQFSVCSLTYAKTVWIKAEQQFFYADMINALKHSKRNDSVRKLNLYLDNEGIIRCQHWLHQASLPINARQPILLAPLNQLYFTKLIVSYFHGLTFHQGTTYTLNVSR